MCRMDISPCYVTGSATAFVFVYIETKSVNIIQKNMVAEKPSRNPLIDKTKINKLHSLSRKIESNNTQNKWKPKK